MSPIAPGLRSILDRAKRGQESPLLKEVDALAVGGSYSRGRADELSDLDLYFLLLPSADASSAWPEISQWIGPALLRRGPVFVPAFGHSYTIVFADLSVCQANLNTRDSLELNAMRAASLIIFDRTGHLTQIVAAARTLPRDDQAAFETNYVWFWQRALFAWRALARGELWRSSQHLCEMRLAMLQLIRLREDYYDPGESPHHPATRFESILGPEIAAEIAFTSVGYCRASLRRALQQSMHWFAEEACAMPHSRKCPSEYREAASKIIAYVGS